MSARIPPGWAEVWIGFTLGTDPEQMYSAIGVNLAAGEGATLVNANLLLDTGNASLRPAVTDDYLIGAGHVIFGQDGGDIRIDGSTTPAAGTNTGTSLPQNCAMLVRKLTSTGGRRGRGRMFIPGINNDDVNTNGDLASAYRTLAQTALDDFMSDLVGLAIVDELVLFHDSEPFTPSVITSLEVQPTLATQRRRMRP